MTSGWTPQRYKLRFRLSNRTLCSRSLDVVATAYNLSDLLEGRAHIKAPEQSLLAGVDGYILRSVASTAVSKNVISSDGFIAYVLSRHPRYYTDFGVTFDEYKQRQFSSKTRSTIQRKIRKFAEHCGGTLDWRAYKSADELREFHTLARLVSSETYQERLLDAGLPNDQAFIDRMVLRASEGRVRAFLLFHDAKPVSYLYLDSNEDTLIFSYLGYLPRYGSWSVGLILQWLAFSFLMDERVFRRFDFTEGEGESKRLFATGSIECANVLFLRESYMNFLLVHLHAACENVFERAAEWLDRMNLKPLVKRIANNGFAV